MLLKLMLLLLNFFINLYELRVACEGVVLVKFGFAGVALATERHVHVSTANQRGAALGRGSRREAGVLLAKLAYGRQLLDLLALRDQREDVLEATPQERALKGSDDYDFLLVGRHFGELDDVSEELAFVDADDVKLAPVVSEVVHETRRRDRLLLHPVVRRD